MNSALKCLAPLFCAVFSTLSTSAQTSLVNHDDLWRYHKGNTPLQSNWKTNSDAGLDATWFSSVGGFGYSTDTPNETNQCRTILADMRNNYTTLYMRKQFAIANPLDTNLHLILTMDFDDGFIAWLDGNYLTSALVTSAPNEPATNATASATHESSRGTSTPVNQPASFDLGPVGARLEVGTHTLAIIGVNQATGSSDLIQIADLELGTAGCPANTICSDTNWTAANSPYVFSNTIAVAAGATLTIEPGVVVLFNQGAGMTIHGRLLAEGTEDNHIVFSRNAGAATWNQIAFTANSSTSRIAHAEMDYFAAAAIEATGTTLFLDSINWTNSTFAAVDLHSCSITLLNSYIPGGAGNEPVHFNNMPANGHALIKGCVFGPPRGYNDSIDFTGGNRPGPVAQFINNIFLAAVDDCFDMDGTDAHIEGNIFLNVHQDAARDSSSNPISTGADSGNRSELVIVRNIFWNCDHALLLKDFGSSVFQNNTVVSIATNQFSSIACAYINFGEPHRAVPGGRGILMDGNILWDLHSSTPFLNYTNGVMFRQMTHSIMQNFVEPGLGNSTNDPLFVNWHAAMTPENIRSNLTLLPGSPALGTGPNGIDMGALVPSGASISGAPTGVTSSTEATLRVAGPGVVAFRWKLNDGPWSTEIPLTNSFLIDANFWNPTNGLVALSGLTDGHYTFSALGKNSAGFWQDTNAAATRTWTVETSAPLRIDNASRTGNVFTFTFIAQAGLSYRVLSRDSLDAAHPWMTLDHIPPQGATGPYPYTDATATPSTRFYQIVTP